MKRIIIISVLASLIYACSPTLHVPIVADASEQKQLSTGRKLYVQHCSSCHNLHFPNEYKALQWSKNLDEMQKRAKLTDDEKQLILRYLTSQI